MNRNVLLRFLLLILLEMSFCEAVIEEFEAIPVSPNTFFLIWKMSADVNVHKEHSTFKIVSQVLDLGHPKNRTEVIAHVAESCRDHVGSHGVTICTHNSSLHQPGSPQTFTLKYYEKDHNLLGEKLTSAEPTFLPGSLRVVDNTPDCLKLIFRLDSNTTWPTTVKVQQISSKHRKQEKLVSTLHPQPAQNLYSAEVCSDGYNQKTGLSHQVPSLSTDDDYTFRFVATYERHFDFLGQTYTVAHAFKEAGDDRFSHVQRPLEERIIFPVVLTKSPQNEYFLNFTHNNVLKKNDDSYRLEYKTDRFTRPYDWIPVQNKYIGVLEEGHNRTSLNITALVTKRSFRARSPEAAEFRLFFRVRTHNGWVWSQPSYSYLSTDQPELYRLKGEARTTDKTGGSRFWYRLKTVLFIVTTVTAVYYLFQWAQRQKLLKISGFSYRKLDSQHEMAFV